MGSSLYRIFVLLIVPARVIYFESTEISDRFKLGSLFCDVH
jgi:hypothetical protein